MSAGRPDRVDIVVTTLGRKALGKPAPRHFRFALDLLHGEWSEWVFLSALRRAMRNTFEADKQRAYRDDFEERMAAREARNAAEHEAFMQTFLGERWELAVTPAPKKRKAKRK